MNCKYIGLTLNAAALFFLLWATRGIVWEDNLTIGLFLVICITSCLWSFNIHRQKR